MKKTLAVITSGFLPVPASKGGAVENLIDIIIKKNEIHNEFTPIIFSIYDEDAITMSKEYKNTEFVFIKPTIIVKAMDRIMFFIADKILHKDNSRSFRYIFQRLSFFCKCSKYLKKNNYDKVILENHPSMYYTLKWRNNYKKYDGRYYYHCHNEFPSCYGMKDIMEKTKKFISVSKFRSNNIKEYLKFDAEKFDILYNCCSDDIMKKVTEQEVIDIKNKYNIQSDEHVIMYIGRVVDDKGILELIQACNAMKDIKYKLVIVGSALNANDVLTEYEIKVKEEIDKCDGKILMTGFVSHDELYKYYAIADVIAVPSQFDDSAPLSLIEAMTNGKAIIATKCGGIPEYADNGCAVFIDRGDNFINNFSSALSKILNEDEYKAMMEHKSKEKSKQYSEDKYYEDFCKVIIQD